MRATIGYLRDKQDTGHSAYRVCSYRPHYRMLDQPADHRQNEPAVAIATEEAANAYSKRDHLAQHMQGHPAAAAAREASSSYSKWDQSAQHSYG